MAEEMMSNRCYLNSRVTIQSDILVKFSHVFDMWLIKNVNTNTVVTDILGKYKFQHIL